MPADFLALGFAEPEFVAVMPWAAPSEPGGEPTPEIESSAEPSDG